MTMRNAHLFGTILCGLLLFGNVTPGRAAISLTLGDTNIAPGGSGFVDVFIRSNSSDVLDAFGAVFRITPLGGGAPELRFQNPSTDTQLDDPQYLFHGDSANELFGPPAGLVTSSGGNPDDTYIGGDGTLSGLGVVVPATDTLLLRLQLAAGVGAAGLFEVSLDTASPDTFFVDPAFASIQMGTVTSAIVGAAVPEPGSIVIFAAFSVVGSLGLQLLKRRQRATP